MKITPAQLSEITEAMAPLVPKVAELLKANPDAANRPMRVRWDWAWACGMAPFITDLYKQGLNDSHIDTGLRAAALALGFPTLAVS